MSSPRYVSTKQFRMVQGTQRPTVTDCVMGSYPFGRSPLRWYRCGYGLFRDVFGEQITFCFGNLTVHVHCDAVSFLPVPRGGHTTWLQIFQAKVAMLGKSILRPGKNCDKYQSLDVRAYRIPFVPSIFPRVRQRDETVDAGWSRRWSSPSFQTSKKLAARLADLVERTRPTNGPATSRSLSSTTAGYIYTKAPVGNVPVKAYGTRSPRSGDIQTCMITGIVGIEALWTWLGPPRSPGSLLLGLWNRGSWLGALWSYETRVEPPWVVRPSLEYPSENHPPIWNT